MSTQAKERLTLEEIANCATHGVGLALSVAGFVALVVLAWAYGDAWHIVSCGVYGASLVALYLASTLYHGARAPRAKQLFQAFDHCGIYLLIAGTYTPFTLVTLGLFIFVVNAICLALTALVVPGFSISGFGSALLGALVVSLVSWLVAALLSDSGR